MKKKVKVIGLCILVLILFVRAPYWSPIRPTAIWRDNVSNFITGAICVSAAKLNKELAFCDLTFGLFPSFHGSWMPKITPHDEITHYVRDWKEINRQIEIGEFTKLERYASEAIHLHKQGSITEYTLNQIFESLRGFPFEEREVLDKWVSSKPNSYLSYYIRGTSYFQEGWRIRGDDFASSVTNEALTEVKALHKIALADLKESIRLNPQFSEAYVSVISLLKTYREGEDLNLWMKRANTQVPGSYYVRKQYLEHLLPIWSGDKEQMYAYAVAQQSLTEDYPMIRGLPTYVMWRLANLMDDDLDLDKKISLYRKSLYHSPTSSSMLALSRLLLRVDDYEAVQESIDYSKEILKHRPDDFWAHYYLSVGYFRMERPKKSREWINRLINLQPYTAAAWSLAAEVELNLGNDVAAINYAEEALKIDDNYMDALFWRTLAKIRQKDSDAMSSATEYFSLCDKVSCGEQKVKSVRIWLEKYR